jgi:predicted RNase H-like HicB family nuclease
MEFEIEYDREEDGRWIAEVGSLPGVVVCGQSRDEARDKVKLLAESVVAEMEMAHRLEVEQGAGGSPS